MVYSGKVSRLSDCNFVLFDFTWFGVIAGRFERFVQKDKIEIRLKLCTKIICGYCIAV